MNVLPIDWASTATSRTGSTRMTCCASTQIFNNKLRACKAQAYWHDIIYTIKYANLASAGAIWNCTTTLWNTLTSPQYRRWNKFFTLLSLLTWSVKIEQLTAEMRLRQEENKLDSPSYTKADKQTLLILMWDSWGMRYARAHVNAMRDKLIWHECYNWKIWRVCRPFLKSIFRTPVWNIS